ncbi:MAG: hypothetical protein KGL78_08215 [Burkholderiales bacterium]|nr:hypothetical protein [Burkholderiales bacterium]
MDAIPYLLAIALVVLVALAVVVVRREHRGRLQEIEERLARSEESRFEAEQHAEAMGARMAELHHTLRRRGAAPAVEVPAVDAPAAPPPAGGSGNGDQAERHAALDQALDRMPHAPRGPTDRAWVDTEPMVSPFVVPAYAPTMPADLEVELSRAAPGNGQGA